MVYDLGRPRRPRPGAVDPGPRGSGAVVGSGFGTSVLEIGDDVYGLTDCYRDCAAAQPVSVDARNLALKPTAIDHLQARHRRPRTALTAWQALFRYGSLQADETVMTHGAAVSLGGPLARWLGARGIGTGTQSTLSPTGTASIMPGPCVGGRWVPSRYDLPSSAGGASAGQTS